MNTKSRKTLSTIRLISGKNLTLGSLLWSIRKSEDMTQSEFADTLGVSKQYLSDLENGRRFVSAKTAASYADKLGYSKKQFIRLCLQDILDREGIPLHVDVKAA